MNRSRLAAVGIAALVVSACGGSPQASAGATTTTSTAGPTTVATAPPATVVPPTQAPTSAPASIDIATVLPDEAGGEALTTTDVSGAEAGSLFGGGLSAIARTLDVDPASMNVAVGASPTKLLVTVVQVPGKDTAALQDAVKYGVSPLGMAAGLTGDDATVGGKAVKAFTVTSGASSFTTYIYVVSDTIFVIAPDAGAEAAEDILTALP